jgi:hypothetical protein
MHLSSNHTLYFFLFFFSFSFCLFFSRHVFQPFFLSFPNQFQELYPKHPVQKIRAHLGSMGVTGELQVGSPPALHTAALSAPRPTCGSLSATHSKRPAPRSAPRPTRHTIQALCTSPYTPHTPSALHLALHGTHSKRSAPRSPHTPSALHLALFLALHVALSLGPWAGLGDSDHRSSFC